MGNRLVPKLMTLTFV